MRDLDLSVDRLAGHFRRDVDCLSGSVGILVACLVALGSVEIMRISIEKGWTIHMPPSVPQVIENTFSTIFPVCLRVDTLLCAERDFPAGFRQAAAGAVAVHLHVNYRSSGKSGRRHRADRV